MALVKPLVFTVPELSKILKSSQQSILNKIHTGEIVAIDLSDRKRSKRGDWRVPVKEAERFLRKCGLDISLSLEIYTDDFIETLSKKIAERIKG